MMPILAVLLATQLSLPQATPAPYSLLDHKLEGIGSGSDTAPPPYSVGTIVVQSLTGTGALILAGLGGFVAGALIAGDGGHGFAALGGGVIGAVLAMPLGFTLGVWVAGVARGHQGSFWATIGTTLLGVGLSVGALALEIPLAMALILPATAVATIWVFHLTDANARGFASVAPPAARPEQRQMVQAQRGVSLLQVAF